MERDGITRVFTTTGGPPIAWESYPNKTPYDQPLQGDKAQAVLDRADFKGSRTSSDVQGSEGRSVSFGGRVTDTGERLEVDVTPRKGELFERSDADEHLARTVEQHIGKTGLTIVVS
jgi:hypothetical protein